MTDAILKLLRSQSPHYLTPGAVSVLLGQGAEGTLGQEPAPEVAAALEALRDSGDVAVLPACPVCGRAGDVWTVPENVPAAPAAQVGLTDEVTEDTLGPLIEEGVVELGERVELVENSAAFAALAPGAALPAPSSSSASVTRRPARRRSRGVPSAAGRRSRPATPPVRCTRGATAGRRPRR